MLTHLTNCHLHCSFTSVNSTLPLTTVLGPPFFLHITCLHYSPSNGWAIVTLIKLPSSSSIAQFSNWLNGFHHKVNGSSQGHLHHSLINCSIVIACSISITMARLATSTSSISTFIIIARRHHHINAHHTNTFITHFHNHIIINSSLLRLSPLVRHHHRHCSSCSITKVTIFSANCQFRRNTSLGQHQLSITINVVIG